jgi:Flp pilus assembly protein TadG
MKQIKNERGQSLVELAISIVILIFLLAGAVEFGMVFFQFVQLRDAAQEGALFGSLNPTLLTSADGPDNVEARVRGASTSPINLSVTSGPGAVTVTSTLLGTGAACETTGNAIQVEVSYDHQIFMPFIPELIGRSVERTIPLSASVTDTILQPACPPPSP